MKVLDQLAGALDSLNLRKEERRKKKLDLRKDQAVSRDQSSPEERSKEFMVEMFRKSIQDIGGETTLKQGGSQSSSQNMRPGMKSWGKVDNLNSSLGSARSRGSEGSSMSSGRVKKTTTSNGQRKGDVEVLRFLSLRLAGGKLYLCPLPGCQFSTNREGMDAGRAAMHLTESHNMQVEPSSKKDSPTFACPLPYCPFTTNRQGLVSGFAAMHYVRSHGITMEEFLTNQRKLRFKRVEPSDHGLSKALDSLSF